MRGYKALEGKIIKASVYGNYKKVIIVGCEKDIGITIMNLEKTKYLSCLRNLSLTKDMTRGYKTRYKKLFACLIKYIKLGDLNEDFKREMFSISKPGVFPSAKNCAFSQ